MEGLGCLQGVERVERRPDLLGVEGGEAALDDPHERPGAERRHRGPGAAGEHVRGDGGPALDEGGERAGGSERGERLGTRVAHRCRKPLI